MGPRPIGRWLHGALAILLLVVLQSAVAQGCTGRAVLTAPADVYRAPPQFVTGVGWRGVIVARLSAGTQVLVCRVQPVDLGFSQKDWAQVAHSKAADTGQYSYGWLLHELLRPLAPSGRPVPLPTLAGWAPAVDEVPLPAQPAWTLDAAAPAPPDAGIPAVAEGLPGGDVALGDQLTAYGPLFVLMLAGMLAKAFFDYLDGAASGTLKAHLRHAASGILISPIVFLGFLSAGQFSGTSRTFLVLALFAFQNGFFWQTVLSRATGSGKPQPARP